MFNQLTLALEADDVNEAIAPIMQSLGIKSGDIAGGILTEDYWKLCNRDERRNLLSQWLNAEIAYA